MDWQYGQEDMELSTICDHPDYNIINIDQNTEKRRGDLRGTSCLSNISKKPSDDVGVKNSY